MTKVAVTQPVLPARDRRRVVAAAALMTSKHGGEVVAAARALVCLLKKGNLDPAGVVSAGLSTVATLPPPPRAHWWSVAQFCACHLDQLNSVEHQFVIDMAHRNTRPSEKQEAWLGRIHDDLNRRAT